MSASNYLPPFTPEERVAISGDQAPRKSVDPGVVVSDPEVTYADFLGDEVDAAGVDELAGADD
ncbi:MULTISPECIES: hypothetical protein [unclassified Curtobacterium]|uniref:hypothetical protein n=1 Tax=unclassified Curtobacterium TaxID=257496 RepID=UPI003802AD15